ncbi:DUF1592 domain-containing protein [Novosphingobium mangrovi (ex Huang et al. 2023)]|uniref:DUF1592 domain-containing protein n=1 Tax=Novosphingobium mangrovi (ex Huang et al. 2023) TaxID=2976432 RepID=A0ABT2I2D3_9SPHN|nr:DUF1592 domain-containing protein [Novosphingobium mangrovi (ex Huang et al. 2023)]MCT2398957.1 DUF1592 domain-containing protein [Novosphingobium mangrovi (ex Huang et al. 2023)]
MSLQRRLPLGSSALALSALVTAAAIYAGTQTEPALADASALMPATPAEQAAMIEPMLDKYCSRCHNDFDMVADLSVDDLRADDIRTGRHADAWEKILRRVAAGEMPPHSKPQPDPATRAAFVRWLDSSRAGYAAANPDPGHATLRRLNRFEYANAVRDLLALDVDFSRELPQDNSGYGFDNIADVLTVSPTLMERYVAVAGKVGRLATGLTSRREFVTTYQVPKDGSVKNAGVPAYNERASADLPLASRGGGAFRYFARYDGEYDIAAWLNSNTNNETDRLTEDRYSARVPMKAGSHLVGLSFRRRIWPDESVQTLHNTTDAVPLPLDPPKMLPLDVWVDGKRVQTLEVPSYRMHERYSQQNFPRDVLQIDVAGPYNAMGVPDTPSRRAIFTCHPKKASQEEACAHQIVSTLARRAWRRPVGGFDIAPLMRIYAGERTASDFEHGVEAAIEAILVSPEFLFVVESDPSGSLPGSVHAISDLELATRLSLFLWSSIPDERLLSLAEEGKLHEPAVLDAEIDRMLRDPRAKALTENFAGQWLYLRNLDQQRPDIDVFPGFDTRLKQAMATETRMFFASVLHANRPVTDFIEADYTFLNQRLAKHYGIPGVVGTAFRKVSLKPEWHRGGLLGQASVLTVTSYNNHTSVVRRGKWILDNILASPPPPPPANVPALKAEHDGRLLSAREQLELHRSDPNCASCHVKMDPLGFALENFDAVGAWRTVDAGQTIDSGAVLPDGTKFAGITGLQQILMDRKNEFARAFTERLMTYALARGVGAQDMPAVREIASHAAADGYRVHTIVKGIAASPAFTMRRTPEPFKAAYGSPLK